MEERKKYLSILLNITIPLLTLYVICFWGPKLLRFFMPFVIGWVIALIANPLVRFLERRLKIVRRHSSMLIIVSVLSLVIFGLYLLFGKLFSELYAFLTDLPVLYEESVIDIREAFLQMENLLRFLPDQFQESIRQFTENIGSYLGALAQTIAAPTVELAGHVAKGIPGVMVSTVVTILSAYSFIAQQDVLMAVIRNMAPAVVMKYMGFLRKDVGRLVGGYFLAQFKIMFVVAFILAAGFLVLAVPYGPVFALLIAMLDFLPIFGTGTVLLPWAVIKVFSGEYAYAVGLALLYVTTQVVRQIIQPKIVGDTMGLPPLVTLFLLYLGFKVNGLAGMILAVPIGMIFINFYKYGAFDSFIYNVKLLVEEVRKLRHIE